MKRIMKLVVVLVMWIALINLNQSNAAKLKNLNKMKELEFAVCEWNKVFDFIKKGKLNEGSASGTMSVKRLKFKMKDNEILRNVALQMWYRFTADREYDALIKDFSRDKLFSNLKRTAMVTLTDIDYECKQKLPPRAKKSLASIVAGIEGLPNKNLKFFTFEQSDSNGFTEGVMFLDLRNKEALILAAAAHI